MSIKKWILKNEDGRIKGPFSTEEVIQQITKSVITGEESISPYPGSDWIPISQDPQFYDKLLEVLSGERFEEVEEKNPLNENNELSSDSESKSQLDDDLTIPPDVETFSIQQTLKNKSHNSKTTSTKSSSYETKDRTTSSKTKTNSYEKTKVSEEKYNDGSEDEDQVYTPAQKANTFKSEEDDNFIELENQLNIDESAKKRAALKPMLGVIAILLLLLTWLFWPQEVEDKGLRLRFPKKSLEKLNEKQINALIKKGERTFILDSYEGYLASQSYFIKALESDIKSHKSWAFLCLTYLELWPFVNQGVNDLKVIMRAERMALASDPSGPNGSVCRAVNLLVQGKIIELKSLVRDILERYGSGERPPIVYYYLKARQLELENQLQASIGYLESAQRLWPSWLRPFVLSAILYKKMGSYSEAATIFQNILRASPKHVVSHIELGIIEYKNFNHMDQGYKRLKRALSLNKKASNSVLAEAHFNLAEISLRYKDKESAKKYIAKAFALNPADPSIKNLTIQLGSNKLVKKKDIDVRQLISEGDQYYREGNWEEAQAHYKTAFELDKKNAIAAFKAAKSLWSLSFSEEAIHWLNNAIQADYKLIQAYVLLADYHAQRYDFTTAGRVLQKANKVSPRSYEVYRGFAQVELRRKNPTATVSFATKSIKIYNMDIESYILLAKAYLMLGGKDESIQKSYSASVKAIEIDPNNREAQVVYSRSMAAIKGVDMGVHYLTKLVKRFPEIMEYRMALGGILFEDQRYQEAALTFRDVTQIQPKYKKAYIELGRVFKSLQNYKNALTAFMSASRLDPGDAIPTFESGLLYLETKKLKEARRQFERVLEINEKYPLAHYYLGEVALGTKNYKEALEQAEKEKKKNPNLPEPYLLSARSYMGSKQYSLCAREYQKAIQLSVLSSTSYVNVAMCYRLSGNFDAAETMIARAAKIESGNPLVYKEQGAIFESKGNGGLAATAYEQYILLNPHAPDRKSIELKIRSLGR